MTTGVCGECGTPKSWTRMQHTMECSLRPRLSEADRAIRLARRHRLENARRGHQEPSTARPKLKADEPHAACHVAFIDGGVTCSRCASLLHPEGCECWPCEKNRYEEDHDWMFQA